ncbi:alpha-glucan phosphorylase [Porphyromonas macacae]|uniref:Alpha-glucan phosphorylase n=1 Tax=Porphyromonas macacae TaxID=28115 RepID=A0A0A2E9X6_9PORP|nr:alpha-glucan family phosphorylase [Porphyromonas macacae]KGN74427.1 alpha-glucan phosphorylase [Porphyromonas macacae]
MIRQKSANVPVWRDIYSYAKLPANLQRIEELSHNLWWVWNPDAQRLFKRLSPELWEKTEGNPVMLTKQLSVEALDKISTDTDLLAFLDDVYGKYLDYMNRPVDKTRPSVAYFSMEYGLTNVLKIYSGGLGVLAGDYLKEASDSNVDLTAVGFLYRYGYFTQTLNADGQQIANYEAQDFDQLPITQVTDEDGNPIILEVPFSNHNVYAHIWQVKVGRIDLYLMDTDIDMNSSWDREITHKLYGGEWENRMRQEYLLGIGGVLLLDKLGIRKDIYHMNEGHAALICVQRLINYVQKEQKSFDEALELVRASTLYTVHTPVPAGHDYFAEDLFGKYMGHIPGQLGITWQDLIDLGRENPGSDEKFSMSVFALNTCQEANGVSKLHGRVSQTMFAPVWKGFFPEELHVGYVTNGVHLPTWATERWQDFYKKTFGPDYLENQVKEEMWSKVQKVPSEEIWEIRQAQKRDLIEYIKQTYAESWAKNSGRPDLAMATLEKLDPNVLLVGFGRRFATYKRAHLLFTDIHRLASIVNNADRPVYFIFTGKAHPADGGGQGLIKHILQYSHRPELLGKILFLENYDIRLAQKLIAGVDVWMNTPTRPLEASGTSGEKAEMNGVLNLSILDGWWYEGYRKDAGWALTEKRTFTDQHYQDKLDATTIYELLENEIAPLYYHREGKKSYSEGWVQFIKNSMSYIAPHYTMRRMLDDYYDRFYNKLHDRFLTLTEDNCFHLKELVAWKENVANNWDALKVLEFKQYNENINQNNRINAEGIDKIVLKIDKGELKCDLKVQMVITRSEQDSNKMQLLEIKDFKQLSSEQNRRVVVFGMEGKHSVPGHQKIGIRILPKYDLLPHPMDFAYVLWIAPENI